MDSIEQQIGGASLNGEERIPIHKVTAYIAKRYGGKRPSISSAYRWTLKGVRGIRLETECVGRTPYTSIAAIDRFIEAVSAARTQATPSQTAVASHSQQAPRHSASAAAELHRRAFKASRSKSRTAKGGAADAAR